MEQPDLKGEIVSVAFDVTPTMCRLYVILHVVFSDCRNDAALSETHLFICKSLRSRFAVDVFRHYFK